MKNDRWWLMECSLPELNWALLDSAPSGRATIRDVDGTVHHFASLDDALAWLSEEEFIPLSDIDCETANFYGLVSAPTPPRWFA